MDPVLLAALVALGVVTLSVVARKRANAVNALMRPADRQAWGDLYNMVGVYGATLVGESQLRPGQIAALAPFNGMVLSARGGVIHIVRFTAEPETYVAYGITDQLDTHAGQVLFPGDEIGIIGGSGVLDFDVYYAVDDPARLPAGLQETDPQAWATAHGIEV